MTPDQIRAQRRQYGATRPDLVPAGSVGWCWVKLGLLETYYRTASSRFSDIQNLWDELVSVQAWRVIPEGEPYGSPEAMLQGELGITMPKFREELSRREQVFRLARDEAITALAPRGGARPGAGRPAGAAGETTVIQAAFNQGSNATLNQGRGAEYLVRRLKRDHPEHAARLAAGEYRSARAAAIAAGIVKPPSLVEQALALVRRMTPAEQDEFWRLGRAARGFEPKRVARVRK